MSFLWQLTVVWKLASCKNLQQKIIALRNLQYNTTSPQNSKFTVIESTLGVRRKAKTIIELTILPLYNTKNAVCLFAHCVDFVYCKLVFDGIVNGVWRSSMRASKNHMVNDRRCRQNHATGSSNEWFRYAKGGPLCFEVIIVSSWFLTIDDRWCTLEIFFPQSAIFEILSFVNLIVAIINNIEKL